MLIENLYDICCLTEYCSKCPVEKACDVKTNYLDLFENLLWHLDFHVGGYNYEAFFKRIRDRCRSR